MEFRTWFEQSEKLYHASQGILKDDILRDGILPQSETGIATWEESDPSYVYLAERDYQAEAWVIAAYKDNYNLEWDRATVVIFEIDKECLDPQLMSPDPGPKGTATQGDGDSGLDVRDRHRTYRYKGRIPPNCIRFLRETDYTGDNEFWRYHDAD